MKNQSYKRIAAALAILLSGPLLTGCGSSEPDAPVAAAPAPVTPGGFGPGMCVPISSQIGFSGTNVYFDSANIYGGMVPGMQAIGQMTVGTGGAGGPLMRSGVDGTISMNVTNTQTAGVAPGTPGMMPGMTMMGTGTGSGMVSVTGFVQISPQTQQDIMYQAQIGRIPVGGVGYAGMVPGAMPQPGVMPGMAAPTQLCVSGIAMNLGHYYNTIHSGHVYLYMNNTQHGYKLYF